MTRAEEDFKENVTYSLIEPFRICKNITYNELLREVDLLEITSDLQMDNYTAKEIYYSELDSSLFRFYLYNEKIFLLGYLI